MKKGLLFFVFSLFLLLGCSNKTVTWESSFKNACQLAEAENKDVLVFFTSNDSLSELFKGDIFYNEKVLSLLDKNYVLYNADINSEMILSTAEYQASVVELMTSFAVDNFPAFVFADAEGNAYNGFVFDETVTDTKVLIKKVSEVQNYRKLAKELHEKKPKDVLSHIKKIDELVNKIPGEYRSSLNDLVNDVIILDPENKSGLLGSYKLQAAYPASMDYVKKGELKNASELFSSLAESNLLKDDEKIEAYCMAAFFIQRNGDNEKAVVLLKRAYEINPESQYATSIKDTISSIESEMSVKE